MDDCFSDAIDAITMIRSLEREWFSLTWVVCAAPLKFMELRQEDLLR